MRHETENASRGVADPGDVVEGAVRVLRESFGGGAVRRAIAEDDEFSFSMR